MKEEYSKNKKNYEKLVGVLRALLVEITETHKLNPQAIQTCAQMSSCAETQYQLNVCGCSGKDRDKDGIACDADCQ